MLDEVELQWDHGPIQFAGNGVRLFEKDVENIKAIAKKYRVSQGYVVRMLIAEAIERHSQKG